MRGRACDYVPISQTSSLNADLQGTHCFLAKQTNDDRMVHRLNELLNIAEELYLKRSDLTAVDKFFGLIEKCVVIRSVSTQPPGNLRI